MVTVQGVFELLSPVHRNLGQIGLTFVVPGRTVDFFGVGGVVPSSTLKMRNYL